MKRLKIFVELTSRPVHTVALCWRSVPLCPLKVCWLGVGEPLVCHVSMFPCVVRFLNVSNDNDELKLIEFKLCLHIIVCFYSMKLGCDDKLISKFTYSDWMDVWLLVMHFYHGFIYRLFSSLSPLKFSYSALIWLNVTWVKNQPINLQAAQERN